MEMQGEYVIPAPKARVWETLNDPEILKASIAGCEELEKVDDETFTAKVRAKVGPVSARFSGKVTLSEQDPPNGYRISGEGQGGAAGFAKGGAVVRLEDVDDGTRLTYEATASVGGKLAQIGSRLIDGTARKMADDFFKKFSDLVGGAPPAGGGSDTDPTPEPEPEPAPAAEPVASAAPEQPPKPSEPAESQPAAAAASVGAGATVAATAAADVASTPEPTPTAMPSGSGSADAPAKSGLPMWAWVVGGAVVLVVLIAALSA